MCLKIQRSLKPDPPRVDPLPSGSVAAAAAADPKSCFYAAKNRAASSLGVGANSFYIFQMLAKTLMGLQLFKVRFFWKTFY